MTTVTVEEAQARLPELLDQLEAGEKIVILRGQQPVAELKKRSKAVSLATDDRPPRTGGFGCCKGMVTFIADDFDAPLEDFKDYM